MSWLTICALYYGDYPGLAERSIRSTLSSVPPDTELRIGLNAVSEATLDVLAEHLGLNDRVCLQKPGQSELTLPGRVVRVYYHADNARKYPVMREMFHEPALDTPWVLWLDDDTWFQQAGWLSPVQQVLEQSGAAYAGEEWFIHYKPDNVQAISEAPWFRGKPPMLIKKKPGILFYTGGFVFLRKEVINKLGWPDARLLHNGGDTLLGEACYQNGIPKVKLSTKQLGIRVNDAKRRGFSERPFVVSEKVAKGAKSAKSRN